MATTESWPRTAASFPYGPENEKQTATQSGQREGVWIWIAVDVLTILGSVALATGCRLSAGPLRTMHAFWRGSLLQGYSVGGVLLLLCGFTLVLVMSSHHMKLYEPTRFTNILREQRLSAQVCFTSGLLLTGTLYLIRADSIPRAIVLMTIGAVTLALGLRRMAYRLLLYRRFQQGAGLRNVLIAGTGPEALALRQHIGNRIQLGYAFKGYIALPGTAHCDGITRSEVLGSLDGLFRHCRKQFADEIFLTAPCDRQLVQKVLEQARAAGVDLRVVPELYDGLVWSAPLEFVGQFPTISLHNESIPESSLLLKRALDLLFALLLLLLLSPLLLLIAAAIKLDSRGPVFYISERLGKKGSVFRCIKFRTMRRDAELLLAEIRHLNEREGALFKVSNDPRITPVGRILRKYSLDELPQFINVLRGEMSMVGPRPPLASEVRQYKPEQLRRLNVMPGITGLWQVQCRQDPSFDKYVSLDVSYIANWSLRLDLSILLRTIGVVLAGTGA
jgi:exopolysaccharide biosynthesis polyprenyl glycosylphosphotransferase